MARTIVVSDLHGDNALLERVLEHASFAGDDRLVVAGDMIDVGCDDVVSAVSGLGATVLVGNHEVAAAMGLRISPQDPRSLERGPEFAELMTSGRWSLATAVDGWLVTHAGVSVALEHVIALHDRDPHRIATALNELFVAEVQRAMQNPPVTPDDLDSYQLLGSEAGPLWFRPFDLTRVPRGLRQIVGHTPPELLSKAQLRELDTHGWRLIEPGHRAGQQAAVRYAVIEDGEAHVVEG